MKRRYIYRTESDFVAWAVTLLYLGIIFAGIAGWILNIVKLLGMSFSDPITVEIVIRVVGIFMFPVGCVVGWIG